MTAAELVSFLKSESIVVAAAESCTGGLIAHSITEIPGSSEIFWGGWVVYDNSAKLALGVSHELLMRHGAVSPEVARELAEAGHRRLQEALRSPDINVMRPHRRIAVVSTTGIAGPSGGSANKPVGLCYIGLAIDGGPSQVREIRAPQGMTRSDCKAFFTREALELLRQSLITG